MSSLSIQHTLAVPAALLILAAVTLTAQTPAVPVAVTLKKGGTTDTAIAGRTGNGLRLQVKGSSGDYLLTFDELAEVRFVLPATLSQAQEALNQNQWERAAAILRPMVVPLLPYLDAPNNNGVSLTMALGDALRQSGKCDDALSFYDKVRALPRSTESVRATIWAASCQAALGHSDQAWRALQTMETPKHDSEIFGQYQFVRAQVRFAAKDYLAALDEVSKAIALVRMESDSYPEALFLAAQCYEALGTANVVTTKLIQVTLPGTNRTAAVLAASNGVEMILPGTSNYVAAAQGIYQDIVTRFPNTAVAQKSQAKLPPPAAAETRKTQ